MKSSYYLMESAKTVTSCVDGIAHYGMGFMPALSRPEETAFPHRDRGDAEGPPRALCVSASLRETAVAVGG